MNVMDDIDWGKINMKLKDQLSMIFEDARKRGKDIVVIPSSEHSTENEGTCWCEPEVEEFGDGSLLVIHRDKSESN